MPDGSTPTRIETVYDPVVISQYMKRRTEADLEVKEYVKHHLRHPLSGRRPPRSWCKLSILARALHRWSTLAQTYTTRAKLSYGPGTPGSQLDPIGFEFRAPAYTYLFPASTARGLRAMPTTTVLQALGMFFFVLDP